ncbi:MAG: hypothetical protein ABSF24_03325 [Candidatus Bathyarchaeia archaeon]
MESRSRVERDVFRGRVKEEWGLLWAERFDDRVRAEGVSVRDYPLVFASRGHVIFATRNAKALSFSQIMAVHASQGLVYSPDPDVGGWGKFARTYVGRVAHLRARAFVNGQSTREKDGQHRKKGGRGWLHK